jgi:phospholipid/cholesterol/gamma-HCH transport system permease protein
LDRGIPRFEAIEPMLAPARRVVVDARDVSDWDSALVVFVDRIRSSCRQQQCAVDLAALPDGAKRLLTLADTRPVVAVPPPRRRPSLVPRLGEWVEGIGHEVLRFLAFVGDSVRATLRLFRGRARFRWVDLGNELQIAGVDAIPIVTVVGALLGMILGFVASVILERFGAAIYAADVVTIGIVRELGPIFTAIVMAGRTGSAYAAQLGTMRVTDEIEALTTMGLSPLEFLVLPRMIALSLMLPLLCVFADAVALISGAIVAISLTDIGPREYLVETRLAIPMSTFWIGLGKSAVFGVLVAVAGCAEGMRAGKSAAAVGEAATSAVVQSIIWIIAADGVAAVILYYVGL